MQLTIKRALFVLVTALLFHAGANAKLLLHGSGATTAAFTPAWASVQIGGGGLMNSVQSAPSDGTTVASSNTYGAYIKRTTGTCAGGDQGNWGTSNAAPCWEQLFTQTSSPQTLTQVTQLSGGVLEIDLCNNNTNDAYAFTQGNLYVTTNLKGTASSRTWAKTPLTTTLNGNQAVSAGTGRAIACDPNNPNIVYAATPAGLNVAANGLSGASASFSVVSTAKVGVTGTIPSAVAFDPTSATTTCAHLSGSPTCTAHFWVFTAGSGVYETYNGGNTFTLTTGGPTTPGTGGAGAGPNCLNLREDPFGKVWAVVGDTHVYKYTPNGSAGGGTWTNSTPTISNGTAAACYLGIDATSASAGALRMATSSTYGSIAVTSNGASTWSTGIATTFSATGAQPGWLGVLNQGQAQGTTLLFLSELSFDASGNLMAAGGVGIWKMPSASVVAGGNWAADSVGLESMVTTHIDTPPGNSPIISFWDRAFFLSQNPDIFPSRHWMDYTYNSAGGVGAVQGGWAWDWATASPFTVTGWAGESGNYGASSPNGAADGSWTAWASYTGVSGINVGGAVAASSATNWLWIDAAQGNQIFVTTTGASGSWSVPTGAFNTPLGTTKQVGFPIAADRVNAGTFCLIDGLLHIWASTNSGAAFTQVSTALTGLAAKYNDALKAVPGQAATFYYSGGNSGGSNTGFSFYKITKTTNECDTVTAVNASLVNIYGYGFGAAKPGGSGFPTIYLWATFSGVPGLYEIDNGGTTPTLLNVPVSQQTWANNSSDFVTDVSGDNNVYGRVYVGFTGSSSAYIDKQDACPWVNFSNTAPNASLTGTVTLQATHSGKVPVTSVSFYVDGVLIGTQTVGSGTPAVYSQSWVTGGVAPGAHTLQVATSGNGCTATASTTFANFSIPVTTH